MWRVAWLEAVPRQRGIGFGDGLGDTLEGRLVVQTVGGRTRPQRELTERSSH